MLFRLPPGGSPVSFTWLLTIWCFLYSFNFYLLLYIIDFSSENENLILRLALLESPPVVNELSKAAIISLNFALNILFRDFYHNSLCHKERYQLVIFVFIIPGTASYYLVSKKIMVRSSIIYLAEGEKFVFLASVWQRQLWNSLLSSLMRASQGGGGACSLVPYKNLQLFPCSSKIN